MRRSVLYFVCALLLGSATACSSDDPQAMSESSTQTESAGTDDFDTVDGQPLLSAVADRVGYTIPELEAAQQRYRTRSVADCLAERGYSVGPAFFSPPANADPSTPLVYGALEDLSDGQVSADPTEGLPADALSECEVIADQNGAAIGQILELVAEAVNEVSDRVQADPDFVSASDVERKCLAALSASLAESDDTIFNSDTAVLTILEDVRAGRVDVTAAKSSLEKIKVSIAGAEAVRSQGAKCSEQRRLLESHLVAEFQRNFLDANPGFVDGVAEGLDGPLKELAEELSS